MTIDRREFMKANAAAAAAAATGQCSVRTRWTSRARMCGVVLALG